MSGCLECGGLRYHQDGCHRALEIQADKILAEDRKDCDCMECKTEFYLDRQHKLRLQKESPSGLSL